MTEAKRTEYVVLIQHQGAWEEVERAHAASAKAAIAQVVTEASGQYVAVPARSFQPVRVTVEPRPKLSFGEPKAEIAEPSAA